MNGFWASLWETFLDTIFGHWQREAWRAEKAQRIECERIARRHQAEAYEMMKLNNGDSL